MDALLKPIEQALLPLFKGLPSLPENSKQALVRFWPVMALILGLLQLMALYWLWNLGHTANELIDYANQVSIASGYGRVTPQLGFFYYLGLVTLLINSVVLLLAFSPLKAHRKKGWDLVFLAALVNIVYGIVIMLDAQYGGPSSLIGALLGSAIGFYFLYQVRDYYTGAKSVPPVASSRSSSTSGGGSVKQGKNG